MNSPYVAWLSSRDWGRRARSAATPLLNRMLADTALMTNQRRLATAVHQPRLDRALTPTTDADRRLLDLAVHFVPTGVPLHGERRIGGSADGGYVMADDLRGTVALSIGIGWDDSWDESALLAGASHVWQFDHTIKRPPRPLPGATFARLGVGPRDDRPAAPLVDLDTMWTIAGKPESLTVKMDVEGAEWEALAAASDDLMSVTRQWAMEWHEWSRLDDPAWTHQATSVNERLSRTHALVAVSANNAAGFASLGALSFPTAIEVTWVRHDLVTPLSEPPRTLRNPLAAPNDARLPLIDLDRLIL